MHVKQPARTTLLYAWIAMMVLTAGTMITGRVTSTETLGILWMSALMVITWLKARYILFYYLNLKAATGGWGAAFNGFLIVLMVLILSIFAIPALLGTG